MPLDLKPIAPEKWYTSLEAAALVPGRTGGPMHPVTISNLLKVGKKMRGRKFGGTWYVQGAELLRYRDGGSEGEAEGSPEPPAELALTPR